MSKPILYLMVGYPGAGKTSVAHIITTATGATHIWADKERREQFGGVYRQEQSDTLYARLNQEATDLLADGKSVVFDTNFNYFRDRERLRDIARQHGADTKVLWINTPKELACHRAITKSDGKRVFVNMTRADFERVASHLEPPRADEQPIIIDGSVIDPQAIRRQLGI